MSSLDDIRNKYRGRSVTLNGKKARIYSIEGGNAACIRSSSESGEASWYTVKTVMTTKGGRFILSRGHLAI